MELSNGISEENLIQKHRKERKDLQAKIQNIKKTSDKKKKKETSELIARLELELKAKQQTEVDKLTESIEQITVENQTSELNEEKTCDDEVNDPPEKISKAQRRRNKKYEQEKENERRIAEQEIENESGQRNLELIAITNILQKQGLVLHGVPSNGDCLYQAILHQLEKSRQIVMSVEEIRRQTALYLRENKNDVLPFMISDNGDLMTDAAFDAYCNGIANTKAWGGQLELKALAEILRCPIHVLQAVGPPTILGDHFTGVPLILTYHRHMYGLGEHYNSTKVIKVNQSESQ